MRKTTEIRTTCVTVRVNASERKRLEKLYQRTTANSLSEYARYVLLRKPVVVRYRNKTADDFLTEMIQLKIELNTIGKNFNQSVHKLHTFDQVPDIRVWAVLNEANKNMFLKQVEKIGEKLQQIYELWCQK